MGILRFLNKKFILVIAYLIVMAIVLNVCIHFYLKYVDEEVEKLTMSSDIACISNSKDENDNGFKVLNVQKDLAEYLSTGENYKSILYRVDGENFYFDVEIVDGQINIRKIVDSKHKLNARIMFVDVITIEYQTGNVNKSLLLKLNSTKDSKYLAITDGADYFLGSDIDNILYKDGQFYYLTYNTKYEELKTATKCDNKTKELIEDFNSNDYYYKTGEINFLKDYYQKIKPSYYYVKNRCSDLKNEQASASN